MSEKLSNLLDKSVNQDELDEFLQQSKDDPSMRVHWQRYHVASAVIKDEITDSDLQFDVADQVMAKLKAESITMEEQTSDESTSNVIPLKPKTPTSLFSKPWVPVAIAASMIMGVYFLVQQPLEDTTTEELVADNSSAQVPNNHWQTNDSSIEDTLNSLLVEHSEFTSVTGMNGLGSYSKFVAYSN